MPRIRTIKPEFCVSEQVTRCSRDARLLFILLWLHCDDAGVHPLRPMQIRNECFPGDRDMDEARIRELLGELARSGLVGYFESAGEPFLYVVGWAKHQKIDRPTFRYPSPPPFDEPSSSTRRVLDDSSPWNGKEGKGKDRKEDCTEPPAAPVGSAPPAARVFSSDQKSEAGAGLPSAPAVGGGLPSVAPGGSRPAECAAGAEPISAVGGGLPSAAPSERGPAFCARGGSRPAECAAASGRKPEAGAGLPSAPAAGGRPAECADEIVLVFPVIGPGPREWPLTTAKLGQYAESFPGLDVLKELRKALQWIRDHPTRRKTARGMPGFLARWLARTVDTARSPPTRHDDDVGRVTPSAEETKAYLAAQRAQAANPEEVAKGKEILQRHLSKIGSMP